MKTMSIILTLLALVGCLKTQPNMPLEERQEDSKYSFPLRTESRYIVDNKGKRVKLKSVNWYGASDSLHVVFGLDQRHRDEIVASIVELGFNSVRLPFSNEMLHVSTQVPAYLLKANPDLQGKTPIEVFDAVVEAMTAKGLLVILNNHSTTGHWCCNSSDDDHLWFTATHSQADWIKDWTELVERYKANPFVIGADLRNEIRDNPARKAVANWGRGGPYDWLQAATAAGNAILDVNPNLLIIVEGLNYAMQLPQADKKPLRLKQVNRVVYSFHAYSFFKQAANRLDAPGANADWGKVWGFLLKQGKPYTAPVWVGEFGTGPGDNKDGSEEKRWWNNLMCYLQAADIDFAYWAINGRKLRDNRRFEARQALDRNDSGYNYEQALEHESYGLLDASWQPIANDWRMSDIKRFLLPLREGPQVVREADYQPCE